MAPSGRTIGSLPEPSFAVQIGDTRQRLKSCVSHGVQRFTPSFTGTLLIEGSIQYGMKRQIFKKVSEKRPQNRKYQSEGGPGIIQVLDLLKGSDNPSGDWKTS